MLYQLHEMQRALPASAGRIHRRRRAVVLRPRQSLSYMPLSRQMAAGLQLVHRIGKDYHEARLGPALHHCRRQDRGGEGKLRPGQALLPADPLRARVPRSAAKQDPTRAAGGPAVGPPRHAAARHRARPAAQPRRVRHRLGRRPHGAAVGRRLPPERLRALRAGIHPPAGPRRACDLGLPAHGAGTGGHRAAWPAPATRRSRAAW